MPANSSVVKFSSEMVAFRHDLHANPELGFQEIRTSSIIAEHLKKLGLDVRQGYGGTGVVGTLTGDRGEEGPLVGFRADMDALPIFEETDVSYRSTKKGLMHACGHDGHSAMLLGAAMAISENRDFAGKLHFIFQPAEELLTGAKKMIDDNLFSDCPADLVFSVHNDPKIPIGQAMTTIGSFMAGADHFDLKIYGKSGHAARPEDCVDPIVAASQLVTLAQSIVSRRIRPTDPAVLSFTKLWSGDSYNVIPEFAELRGTFRTMNPALSDLVEASLEELAKLVTETAGGKFDLSYRRVCPVLINADRATEIAKKAVLSVLDDGKIIEPSTPIMGTEDFAYMAQGREGCLIRLGARPGEEPVPGLHNAYYDFNDDLLPLGASIWVDIANQIFRDSV